MENQDQFPPFFFFGNNEKASPELFGADRLGVRVRRVQHHACQLLD